MRIDHKSIGVLHSPTSTTEHHELSFLYSIGSVVPELASCVMDRSLTSCFDAKITGKVCCARYVDLRAGSFGGGDRGACKCPIVCDGVGLVAA